MICIADYNKAISISPDNEYSYYMRGLAKVKMKEFSKAISDYDKAIELYDKYGQAYYQRGLAKLKTGLKDDACKDFEKAVLLGVTEAQEQVKNNCK